MGSDAFVCLRDAGWAPHVAVYPLRQHSSWPSCRVMFDGSQLKMTADLQLKEDGADGVDRSLSVGDITLTGNLKYNATSSGTVAFMAKKLDGEQTFTASGETVTFDTVSVDWGVSGPSTSGYDSSTSEFTAPVDGLYMFVTTLRTSDTSGWVMLSYQKAPASTGTFFELDLPFYAMGDAGTGENTILQWLWAGDKIKVSKYYNEVGTIIGSEGYTRFMGVLLAELQGRP